MDVNLLPDELKKREEAELKRARPVEVPMSSPAQDSRPARPSLAVPGGAARAAPPDPLLPHVRGQSYIQVSREGRIIRQSPVSPPPPRRPSPSRWRLLLAWFSRGLTRLIPSRRAPLPRAAAAVAPSPSAALGGASRASAMPPPQAPQVLARATPPLPVASEPPPITPSPRAPAPRPLAPAAPAPAAAPAATAKLQPRAGQPGRERGLLGPPPLGINLLPAEWSWGASLTLRVRRRVLVVLTVLLVTSVLGSYAARLAYTARQAERLDELSLRRQALQADIDAYQASEVAWVHLKNQLLAISALLQRHIVVRPILAHLGKTVLPTAAYTGVSVSGQGQVSVRGVTVSYEELARQIVALQSDSAVSDLDIRAVAFDEPRQLVTFDLDLTVSPNLWRYGAPPAAAPVQ